MTDYWSTQTGRIHDILTLDCENGGAISEGSAVEFGTTSANKLVVNAAGHMGDGSGIALKAASATTGEIIPVLFHGVYKCTQDNGSTNITVGCMVLNSVTTTVTPSGTVTTAKMMGFGGTSHFLGMALQATAADGDSVLVLVGRVL